MENFVDRFCLKLQNNDDEYKFRNTVYCLTLINYNEKGLKHLSENFKHYKHILHDEEVYSSFQYILSNAVKQSKQDLKPITLEIEAKIESVFEIQENADGAKTITPPKKPKLKKATAKRVRKKKGVSSDSSDSEPEKQTKRKRGRRQVSDSD